MHKYFEVLAKNKGRGEFKAEKAADSATLYLYDAIVSSDLEAEWFGGVAPKSFIDQLKSIDAKEINLRINSPGGSVFAARAMEQALREHPAKIVAHIDGYAASAASFLVMAADEIRIAPGAMVMIHKAWTGLYGNADDLRKEADLLDKIDGTLVDTYAARSGKDKAVIADWMAAETWFTAQEAVDAGLADAINESDAKAQTKAWDLSAYANAPAVAFVEPPKAEVTDALSARQAKLYEAFEEIADEFGPFDRSTGAAGSHYTPAENNPFVAEGLICSNCALYAGPRGCDIINGDIDPNAVCKFWIIPENLLPQQQVIDTSALLRKLEVASRI